MAACRIVNAALESAVTEIKDCSTQYTNAATDFITEFKNAMDSIKKLIYAILIVIALCLPMIKKGIITLWFKIFPNSFIKHFVW